MVWEQPVAYSLSQSILLFINDIDDRGNKYSKKSIHHSPRSSKFWDFRFDSRMILNFNPMLRQSYVPSIDDFAWHDIPDSITYILQVTKAEKLSYIGFSQGTAQAFAALSIHPQLNEKVNVFIALAPAMSPAGLAAPIVDGLMKSSYVCSLHSCGMTISIVCLQANFIISFLWPQINSILCHDVAIHHLSTYIRPSH